jgi:hypothetical protein
MLTAVHQHFNLRKICDLELDTETEDALLHPQSRYLKDRRRGDPHEVKLNTTAGPLVLFRVRGNGVPYVVTPTPQAAFALAQGWSRVLK